MGKKTRERALAENEAKAVARMLRVSPQKLNLVAQLIRGKKVATALADLEFSRKRIARDVRKCLQSAMRRSSCCAIDSATSWASSSGLRISTMLITTSDFVSLVTFLRSFSMSAPFLPMTTPGRAD